MSILGPFRVLALVFCAAAALLPGAARAQDSPLHVDREYRFAAIFPGEPAARDIAYTTAAGASVPARQFFIEGDMGRYAVTVVGFATGPSADCRAVEHAAENLRRRGEVLFQAAADYDPGIPGRQLDILETGGRQLRASVYMYDRRLYIAEASAPPGDLPALQFEQSIMLLDENGDDVDRDGIEFLFGLVGRILGIAAC